MKTTVNDKLGAYIDGVREAAYASRGYAEAANRISGNLLFEALWDQLDYLLDIHLDGSPEYPWWPVDSW